MSIDLSSGWLRKDIATPSTYYGYSNVTSASDTDGVWSIRKITASGSTDVVTWSDNIYSSKWSERTDYFIAPTASLGITYSVSSRQNSFSYTHSYINTSWLDLSGVDKYRILITDHTGISYNFLGEPFVSAYTNTAVTDEIFGTHSLFKGRSNMTYSISITAINSAGSTSSTVTVRT